MKFNTTSATSNSNFKESKRIVATIDNPVKMLRMFTKDLYKNPLRTSIQEYINNAKDAHTMANKDCSTIEITAPTVANQNVIIKDYGTGLSPSEVENVFARITASNKDQSDKFNGGFGIGSKSWFAVNPSFYVVSTHNGTKTFYEISFTDNIYIDVQNEESTDEDNGVEIILPLANSNQIEPAVTAIKRAIKFWSVRPKLINLELGELPCFYEDKDFKIIAVNCKTELSVTLGETQYSINDFESLKRYKNYANNYSIQIKFNVGEVKLSNSQEVGPDRENFTLSMEEPIIKKLNNAVNKIPSILKKCVKLENDLNKIKEIVQLREYPHETYSLVYKGLSVVVKKHSKAAYDRNYKEYWTNKGKFNEYIPLDPTVLLIKLPKNMIKHKKLISKQILKSSVKFNYVCFVNTEGEFNEERENIYKEFFTIKEYSAFKEKIKLPQSFEEKLEDKDPQVNIIERGLIPTSSNRIKIYTVNKKLKISELDKKIPVISSAYWSKSTCYNILKSLNRSVSLLNLEYYVASPENLKILLHFGFKELTTSEIKSKKSVYDSLRKKEKENAKNEKIKKLKDDALKITTKNQLKWYNLVSFLANINNDNDDFVKELNIKKIATFFPENKDLQKISRKKLPTYHTIKNLKRTYSDIVDFKETYPQETKQLDFLLNLKETYPLLFLALSSDSDLYDDEIKKLIKSMEIK